jgi:lipopolysaccharide/colanic/teichoic acid biosynthesis glycosyltransferase
MMLTSRMRWIEVVGEFLIAGVLLILVLPVVAIVAVAVELDSPGPVLCRQEVVGPGGYRYNAIKFRTAVHQIEPDDGVIRAPQREAQFTRVRWLLWYTRLEKLPQLINVLTGDMSCIGASPRRSYFLS